MISILSWNINGFRAILQKGALKSVWEKDYDIICFQEVKLVDIEIVKKTIPNQYYIYSNVSEDKGRNGVITLTKIKACSVEYVIGHEKFDKQGRYIRIDYPEFSVINLYMPHGRRDKSQLNFKIEVAETLGIMLVKSVDKKIIIATDFNIARGEIDVCRAKQNQNSIMFTDAERMIISKLYQIGYRDSFREMYPSRIEYTWWSYAFECRKRNIGWRIDYFFVSKNLLDSIVRLDVIKEQLGSDHCPILMYIRGDFDGNIR